MGFFKKLSRAMSSKKYRTNPNGNHLSVEEYVAISIGAINGEQTSCYIDSLTTGLELNQLKKDLGNYYGIVEEDSAVTTLSWLLHRGHRVYYDAIKDFCAEQKDRIDDSNLEDDEKVDTYSYIKNLNSAIDDLISEGFIRQRQDLINNSTLAFDAGRLVVVARCCYDLGYINEQEAWDYINEAYGMCKSTYHSWQEVASGYVIGRAMWSGEGIALNGIMGITKRLLTNDDSPWKKYLLQ